jgi:hypothetical protein
MVTQDTIKGRRHTVLTDNRVWPPAEYALPATIEEIEAGRPPEQADLFGRDENREARLARILGSVPGVTLANKLTGPPWWSWALTSLGLLGREE